MVSALVAVLAAGASTLALPAAAMPEPDPQPTEIVDPTIKPTLPVLPSPTPSEASVPPAPTESATAPAPSDAPEVEAEDGSAALIALAIVFAALAVVGAVLALLALSRRRAGNRSL